MTTYYLYSRTPQSGTRGFDKKTSYCKELADLLTSLAVSKVGEIQAQTTCVPADEYLDARITSENINMYMKIDYVIAVDNADNYFCFYVDSKRQIAGGVLRLFLSIDYVTTFFTPSKSSKAKGIVLRTNNSNYENAAKTLNAGDVGEIEYLYNSSFDASNNWSDDYILLINLQITSGKHLGEFVYAKLNNSFTSDISQLPQIITEFSLVDRANFFGWNDGRDTDNVVIKNLYLLPVELAPTLPSTSACTFYTKGNATSSNLSGSYWTYGKLYTGGYFEKSASLIVKPEQVYRIGTYTDYLEIAHPSKKGEITYYYRIYTDLVNFKLVVAFNGIEYDITNGVELPLLDSVQLAEANQRKTNATIMNALSIIGQTVTTVASFATGNFLAGALSVGGLVNSVTNTVSNSQSRITGGTLVNNNAGLINLAHGYLLGVSIGRPLTYVELNSKLALYGYAMSENYNGISQAGRYYEINFNELPGIEMGYAEFVKQKFLEGVIIVA